MAAAISILFMRSLPDFEHDPEKCAAIFGKDHAPRTALQSAHQIGPQASSARSPQRRMPLVVAVLIHYVVAIRRPISLV
jgi:hypothetical protein